VWARGLWSSTTESISIINPFSYSWKKNEAALEVLLQTPIAWLHKICWTNTAARVRALRSWRNPHPHPTFSDLRPSAQGYEPDTPLLVRRGRSLVGDSTSHDKSAIPSPPFQIHGKSFGSYTVRRPTGSEQTRPHPHFRSCDQCCDVCHIAGWGAVSPTTVGRVVDVADWVREIGHQVSTWVGTFGEA